jgi:hypothetical protein
VKQNLTSPQEKDPYSYQDLDEYFPHTPYITFPVYNAFYTVKERASQYQDDSHYEMSLLVLLMMARFYSLDTTAKHNTTVPFLPDKYV